MGSSISKVAEQFNQTLLRTSQQNQTLSVNDRALMIDLIRSVQSVVELINRGLGDSDGLMEVGSQVWNRLNDTANPLTSAEAKQIAKGISLAFRNAQSIKELADKISG